MINPDLREYLSDVARRLDAAEHRKAGEIVNQCCAFMGWSRAKLYKRLRDVGWSSGRKVRSDKGTTSVPDDSLDMLATAQRESLRANGKQILFMPDAAQILEHNGVFLPVSNGHLNKLLRDRKMNVTAMRRADPVQSMRSEHPNWLHEVDPSLCVVYYLHGKQAMMDHDKFYKNKMENYAKVKLKVWRYVLWDHASSVIVTRYYEAAGENQTTLYEFLMWAWSKQPGREFHGVPKYLLWDKGSANTSATIQSLCDALEVDTNTHKAGKARVKGGVEGSNNIVETKFESRLKLEPVNSVEQLNAAALDWQNAFNANLIPRQNNRLVRNHIDLGARYDLWRLIRAEELRTLPENAAEICRPLMEGVEIPRKVSSKLTISYRHPRAERVMVYHLSGLDGICSGDEVRVRPLLFGELAIHIRATRYDGGDLIFRVEPETDYDRFGRPMSAPLAGQEYKALPDTQIEKAAKRMDELAYPGQDADKARAKQTAPFGGLNAHSHLADIYQPTALPKRGTALNVPDRAHVEIKRMTHAETAALLTRLLPDWGREDMRALKAGWPDGVLPDDVGTVADALRQARELTQERPKLALVS